MACQAAGAPVEEVPAERRSSPLLPLSSPPSGSFLGPETGMQPLASLLLLFTFPRGEKKGEAEAATPRTPSGVPGWRFHLPSPRCPSSPSSSLPPSLPSTDDGGESSPLSGVSIAVADPFF